MKDISWKGILYGILSYPILYTALAVLNFLFGDLATPDSTDQPSIYWNTLLTIFGWLTFVIPGYIAGKVAAVRGLMHGVVVGIVIGVLSVVVDNLLFATYSDTFGQSIVFVTSLSGFLAAWKVGSDLNFH